MIQSNQYNNKISCWPDLNLWDEITALCLFTCSHCVYSPGLHFHDMITDADLESLITDFSWLKCGRDQPGTRRVRRVVIATDLWTWYLMHEELLVLVHIPECQTLPDVFGCGFNCSPCTSWLFLKWDIVFLGGRWNESYYWTSLHVITLSSVFVQISIRDI